MNITSEKVANLIIGLLTVLIFMGLYVIWLWGFMCIWNLVMVPILHLSTINLEQAFLINILWQSFKSIGPVESISNRFSEKVADNIYNKLNPDMDDCHDPCCLEEET